MTRGAAPARRSSARQLAWTRPDWRHCPPCLQCARLYCVRCPQDRDHSHPHRHHSWMSLAFPFDTSSYDRPSDSSRLHVLRVRSVWLFFLVFRRKTPFLCALSGVGTVPFVIAAPVGMDLCFSLRHGVSAREYSIVLRLTLRFVIDYCLVVSTVADY